jgi:hypothetical protein
MFAAVAMGVFDRLESSPATVEKLAADLSTYLCAGTERALAG